MMMSVNKKRRPTQSKCFGLFSTDARKKTTHSNKVNMLALGMNNNAYEISPVNPR